MCNGGAHAVCIYTHIHITKYFYHIEGSYYHEVRWHYKTNMILCFKMALVRAAEDSRASDTRKLAALLDLRPDICSWFGRQSILFLGAASNLSDGQGMARTKTSNLTKTLTQQ